jgi:mannose-6-phosphate isomerase
MNAGDASRDLRGAAMRGPLRLLPNRLRRFYRGGAMIDAHLGVPDPRDDNWSEEWIGNATGPLGGDNDHGLARAVLLDGSTVTVRELIESRPEEMLGPEHVARYGTSPALLLKYLDVRSHIPVHVHPTRAWAERHLGSPYGKNEAWLVLGARAIDGEPARVWVGWREPLDREALWSLMEGRDLEAMRAAMHAVEVRPDDVLWVPGGLAHSLGPGVFAMEPQEPTDFGIFPEHWTYGLSEEHATNGLGWETALDAVDLGALTPEELEGRIRCPPGLEREEEGGRHISLVAGEAEEFFRLGELQVSGALDFDSGGAYALLCVREGAGSLRGPWGKAWVRRGESILVPAALGPLEVVAESRGPLRVLCAQPPLP